MAPKQRPLPLHGDTFALLDLQDAVPGRRVFLRRLDDIAAAEVELQIASPDSTPRRSLSELFDRGWVHGSDTFREIVLEAFGPAETKVPTRSGNSNYRSSELGKAFGEAEARTHSRSGTEALQSRRQRRRQNGKGGGEEGGDRPGDQRAHPRAAESRGPHFPVAALISSHSESRVLSSAFACRSAV